MLYICSLSKLHDTVERTGARHLVTLINEGTSVNRPASIRPEDHLFLGFNDIVEPIEGMIPPGEIHVEALLGYVSAWERQDPLVIHCFAGISRSTAAAYITACALKPERDEAEIADALRAASPSATPNARLVMFADRILGREGRMVSAIRNIGRGRDAFEGEPFELALD
ncbi:tyrosine phosphatase family protein [Breoghania sp.]|uniref:tyrosine phosphatase family protein n=1 Tax=Breoghania sp. TaxID=2065378 RepID=UPI0026107730|nr:tyrosine phosphatase family protein [Breoghania sp.]MDJ0933293.1 tyrosine phosphatase family protein [Breoghania sp.]